jgi:hypothetical protein
MKYNRDIEQARWEELAAALGCPVAVLVEWYCWRACWELDEEAAPLH